MVRVLDSTLLRRAGACPPKAVAAPHQVITQWAVVAQRRRSDAHSSTGTSTQSDLYGT
jgi:hypothetical protein